MAYDGTRKLKPWQWTLLNASGQTVSEVTFRNQGHRPLWVRATVGETPPPVGVTDGAELYAPGEGELLMSFAVFWPGLIGANRMYGMFEGPPGTRPGVGVPDEEIPVRVSHA